MLCKTPSIVLVLILFHYEEIPANKCPRKSQKVEVAEVPEAARGRCLVMIIRPTVSYAPLIPPNAEVIMVDFLSFVP